MNMEELKLIAETIGKLGEAGQSAFGWWLLADKVLPAICWTIVPAVVCFAVYKVVKLNSAPPPTKHAPLIAAYEAVRHAWLYGNTKYDRELHAMYQQLKQMAEVEE